MPYPFDTAFMERALVEVLLLAVVGGVLGAWIVLRRLAFASHAVGTATFPGLVVADAAGIPAQLPALLTGVAFTGGIGSPGRERRVGDDARTALLLVAALALGIVLAGDVFESGAGVDRLLFGSLLGLSGTDLWLTAAVAVAVLGADAGLHRRWLASGFDPVSTPALGVRTRASEAALLALTAAAVVVALAAVGALLVAAILVLPAATARLLAGSVRRLQALGVAIAAAEGIAALVIARELNVGPGAALAVLGGLVFAAVALLARRPA